MVDSKRQKVVVREEGTTKMWQRHPEDPERYVELNVDGPGGAEMLVKHEDAPGGVLIMLGLREPPTV